MRFKQIYYPESAFGGFTDMDGTVIFYARINALLEPSFVVLDFGCGRGARRDDEVRLRRELCILRGKVRKVIGLDVDEAAAENPFVDEFNLLTGARWPIADGSIDLIVSDSVLEHIERPEVFFSECRRTIRPGGYLCLRTPNKWSYVGLASRLVPNRFHSKVLTSVQDDRKEEDVFPTFYACNSVSRIRRALREHGFDGVVYGFESEPSYLSFSRLAFRFGVLHQRLSPRFLKPAIFVFARARKA